MKTTNLISIMNRIENNAHVHETQEIVKTRRKIQWKIKFISEGKRKCQRICNVLTSAVSFVLQ